MTFKFHHAAMASLAVLASALVAGPACAQEAATTPAAPAAAEADSGLGDIVVTARKVAEASQSLPITVAAFSGAELNNKVVLNAQDLQTITPGLTISNNSTGGVPIFAIRGTATELGIDGGVALYFNDVPLISTVGIMSAFYDISSVEVLKGPQGTQFGTNTTGGTISIRTNRPTDRFEGYVKAGYGNYNRREFEGVINIPVNDVLGFRFAGNYVKRDGYVRNLAAAGVRPDRLQDENRYSLRGTMSLKSGPISNDVIVDYYNRDEKPFGYIPLRFATSGLGIDLGANGAQLGTYNTVYQGPNPSGINQPLYGKAELVGVQDLLNMQLSDNLALRNVVGYRHDHLQTSEENSGTTIVTVGTQRESWASQWTDDLTLRYTGLGGRLRAAIGGYASILDTKIGFNVNVLQGLFARFGAPNNTINTNNFEVKSFHSKAVYFNTEFDVTDRLGISGGFRYNWDNVHSRVTAGGNRENPATPLGTLPRYLPDYFPSAALPCAAGNLAGYTDKDLSICSAQRGTSFRAPSWNAVATWKFSPKVLAYAKISHGYLAGGTNFTLRDPGRTFYAPETNTMIEAGVKADWYVGERPIRTNLALYRGKIKNKQVFANANYDGGGTGFGVVNAARETVYGLDFEARYSPVPGLTLDASYNYIHAKFDEFIYPGLGGPGAATFVPAVDLSGATPAQTPKHQVNGSISYVWPLAAETGKVTTTVSGYYTSRITQANRLGKFDADRGGEFNTLPGYFLVNASLNWENLLASPVSAQLWVRNLTNKHYLTATSIQFATFGYATGIYGAPRTFGASATVKF